MTEANDWNQKIIDEFRRNGGNVGGQFAGAPLLLLHSKGAKSGEERANPVMYRDLGGRYAVSPLTPATRKIPPGITTWWPIRMQR